MAVDSRIPWQESQAIRPPDSVRSKMAPTEPWLGAYDPETRSFAPPGSTLGSRERAVSIAMSSAPESGVEYSDFEGAGGWGYRLYEEGTIKIIKAPEGHKAGAKLSGGRAYDAIWSEIGSTEPSFSTANGPRAGGVATGEPTPGAGMAAANMAAETPTAPAQSAPAVSGDELIARIRGVPSGR